MNTRQNLPTLTIGMLSALGLLLAACGEQTGEQQSTAPTTEQQSETTTQ